MQQHGARGRNLLRRKLKLHAMGAAAADLPLPCSCGEMGVSMLKFFQEKEGRVGIFYEI